MNALLEIVPYHLEDQIQSAQDVPCQLAIVGGRLVVAETGNEPFFDLPDMRVNVVAHHYFTRLVDRNRILNLVQSAIVSGAIHEEVA